MFRNQNHAWLIVDGSTFYNWSYMSQDFRTDVGGNPRLVTCTAKPHFARDLRPW